MTDADARAARFEALVLPHLDRLLAFARRRTSDPSDAEDAVQDACAKAWLAFDDLRDLTSARAWMYRILRTVLIDAHIRGERRPNLVSVTRLDMSLDELLGGEPDALFDEVVARIGSEQLQAALARLPEEFGVAVELHDIDGFKYREIAEIVGVPIGTVMSRISRGRRLLAGVIADQQRARRAAPEQAAARASSAMTGGRE